MNWPFLLWFLRRLRLFAALHRGHAIFEYAVIFNGSIPDFLISPFMT